jgi:hypothetical protein
MVCDYYIVSVSSLNSGKQMACGGYSFNVLSGSAKGKEIFKKKARP